MVIFLGVLGFPESGIEYSIQLNRNSICRIPECGIGIPIIVKRIVNNILT